MRGIVGTAGHIDHGKTALIGALTGEDTDRLPEEQRRGISIDLGFTHLDTRDGVLGVIDVPGHEDFIRNMLAGATGIDVLLLVVAADEGVMPQTREHLAIAELLGVHRAVVALTKTDLVGDDWLGLVHDDLADFLADSPFAGAPVVPTSTVDGSGIEDVRKAIEDVFAGTRGRPDDLFRLPVDRTFTVQGTGTVVTGTVWSGRVAADAMVRVLPGSLETRVRGLQVHGVDVDAVEAGQRAAMALAGVDRDAVARGVTVVAGPGWTETSRLTVTLRVLPGTGWEIESWQRVRVHLGTAEVMARAVLLEADRLASGQSGLAQLRLEAPLVARAGDRFVVRSYSPITTIGGGVVAEPLAPKRTRVGPEERGLLAAVLDAEEAGTRVVLGDAAGRGVERDRLPILTGATPSAVAVALAELGAVEVGGRVFHPDAAEGVRVEILDSVERYHRDAPLRFGIDAEALRKAVGEGRDERLVETVLAGLLEEGSLAMGRGKIALRDFQPEPTPEQEARLDRIREVIAGAGIAPPRLDELDPELAGPGLHALVELLEARGSLVRIEHDLFVDRGILDHTIARLRDRLAGRTELSPGDFREVLDVSRRHLIPLLEYLDREGVTVRTASGREVTAG